MNILSHICSFSALRAPASVATASGTQKPETGNLKPVSKPSQSIAVRHRSASQISGLRSQVSGFVLLALLCGRLVAADSAQAEYVLQPMDLVKVEVFQEPDMERQVRITQDSSITLPLINRVDLKGKTVQQAQDAIRDLYNKDFLVNPQINLTVMEYAKRDVKVLGQVTRAGAVEIPTDRPLKLLDAIALAEGFTRLADRKRVTLTRTDADGKTTTTEINVDSIIQSKNSADQWVLQQGDVINVPERLL